MYGFNTRKISGRTLGVSYGRISIYKIYFIMYC